MMYNAVGIDISKGKSTIAVLQPGGTVVRKPFDVKHSSSDLKSLVDYISSLEGDTKAVLECTGRYHEPVVRVLSAAGIFVSAVNPHLIRNFGNNTIRKVKSDPADSRKIARYTLDNWASLRQYSGMDTTREQLKTLNAQMDFFTKQKISAQTNLISLLDMTYPGVNDLFDCPTRSDGSQKWVDYAASFWHVDCVRKIGLTAFTERYQSFCRRHGYNYQPAKPKELFDAAKELVAVFPKEKEYKNLVLMGIRQLNATAASVEQIRHEMDRLASTLPEYGTVMSMRGVGSTLGPQLIAEIGDIRNYHDKKSLVSTAGIDVPPYESGKLHGSKRVITKKGNGHLRRHLYLLVKLIYMSRSQSDPAIHDFMMRKSAEGKLYKQVLVAGMRKFLHIYYARVKEEYKRRGIWKIER